MKRNILLPLLFICLAACKKEGTLQEEKHVMEISANSYWADETAVSALSWNNALVLDSMSKARNSFTKRIVEKGSDKQHLTLKNLSTGEIWIDTLLNISDNAVAFTILQFDKTAKPQFLLKAKGETAPDKRNIGFTYSDPQLPEKLTLELYRVTMVGATPTGGTDAPFVTIENIERGKFAGFTTINYYAGFETSVRFVYKLKNAITNEYLPNGDAIDPARFSKGGRLSLTSTAFTNGNLIFDIRRNVSGGVVSSYASSQLAAF